MGGEPRPIPVKVEVTPQMIEAGIQTLWARQENASSGELVEAVFLAMLQAGISRVPHN